MNVTRPAISQLLPNARNMPLPDADRRLESAQEPEFSSFQQCGFWLGLGVIAEWHHMLK